MTSSNYKVRGKPVYLVLPYGGRMKEEVKIKIKRLMERFNPQVDFNLMFKTAKSIGDVFNFKVLNELKNKIV